MAQPRHTSSFNLNLLECKCADLSGADLTGAGFNLNLLECKFPLLLRLSKRSRVLISTYWNVNFVRTIVGSEQQ